MALTFTLDTPADPGVTATPANIGGGLPGSTNPPDITQPSPLSVTADPVMPARAKAGVELSRLVLYMIAGSIVLLLLSLLWLGSSVSDDVKHAYANVLEPSHAGTELQTLARIEELLDDLGRAKSDLKWQMTQGASDNEAKVLDFLAQLPSVTGEQKTTLAACKPLPVNDMRVESVTRCIAVLNDVRQSALQASASVASMQIAAESVDKMLAHRQSLFTFWMQASQMILLNLLLPLLTALFGYIFGSQQAERNP